MGAVTIAGGAKADNPKRLYLYREGKEYESLTGGWIAQGLGLEVAYNTPVAPTLTKHKDNMVVIRNTPYGNMDCGIILPKNKIDFTKYNALNIRFDVSLIAPNCLFSGYLKNELGAVCTDGTRWFLVAENTGYYHENVVQSVDISDLNGLYVPYFSMYSGGCATIHEVWLERE